MAAQGIVSAGEMEVAAPGIERFSLYRTPEGKIKGEDAKPGGLLINDSYVSTSMRRFFASATWQLPWRGSKILEPVAMQLKVLKTLSFSLRLLIGACALFLAAAVEGACEQPVGGFSSLEGNVSVQAAGTNNWAPAGLDTALCEGDAVRAGKLSRAAISLITDAVLRLDEETTVKLVDVVPDPQERSFVDLIAGAFQSFSRNPRHLTVNTPYLNGSIEGTEFVIRVNDGSTDITVFEGTVIAANQHGEIPLGAGQSGSATKGSAPQRRVLVKPRNEVQWSIYYPPVMFAGDVSSKSPVQDAAQLLSVGRYDQALTLLDQVIGRGVGAADAYALRAIVKIAQNQTEAARDDADQAVGLDPTSASAKIALSYVMQSQFEIPAARDLLSEVVARYPDNALAWARLSELELMLDNKSEALAAADNAVAAGPTLARSHMVRGFVALSNPNSDTAQASFEKAISLDSSDPMSHLGVGLSKIRDGKLAEGRKDLEAAVALDSNNALLRSYLGKAYFEEKRSPLDEQQYDIAKSLDAQDPTPLFYNAIQLQTNNRPVEALGEVQQAIDMNENRAVYRSRLLLDSDEAARGASLARIYSDLGFQQLGLVEGWKSVDADPTNSAGHRFLADSYSVRPRHEIARVSELLQSQLLQPLSKAAVQPQAAESNLFLISSGGAETGGFNEFNPVFNSDGMAVQASTFTGENGTSGGEGVVSGIHDNIAFSLGRFHYRTDGFGSNYGQHDDIANAFVQMQLSASTSIQAEYRKRETRTGEQIQYFFEENVLDRASTLDKKDTYRLGARHDLAPNSTLLVSLAHQERSGHDDLRDFFGPGVNFFIREPNKSFVGEFQHIYRSPRLNLRSGGGHADIDRQTELTVALESPPIIFLNDLSDTDIKHENIYSYADISIAESLTANLGFSYDFVKGDDIEDIDQFNPKFGITWAPSPQTTVRAAAFKTLKRTLATQQTLEPTQVAGFNQFYDDINQAKAWRYGVAVDQKFSNTLFGGVELSKRYQTIPLTGISADGTEVDEFDWDEDLARLYVFYTPHPYVALRAEYVFERHEQEVFGAERLDTNRIPLGLKLSLPSGLAAALTTTYWKQEGDGFRREDLGGIRQDAQDDFWLVDAVLNYRLPRRYGFVEIGATNLTNKEFRYFEMDLNNSHIQPTRTAFVRLTLSLR